MFKKSLVWHLLASHPDQLDWRDNGIAVAQSGDRKICIARHRDDYHAFAYKCPHAGGIMAEGFIDPAGNAVCPLHRYRFSIRNGRNVSGEGYHLKTYPLRVDDTGIHVGMEESFPTL